MNWKGWWKMQITLNIPDDEDFQKVINKIGEIQANPDVASNEIYRLMNWLSASSAIFRLRSVEHSNNSTHKGDEDWKLAEQYKAAYLGTDKMVMTLKKHADAMRGAFTF